METYMVRMVLTFGIVFLASFYGHAQNFINPGGPVESRFLEIKDSVNTNDTLVFFSHYPGEDIYYGVVLFKHEYNLKRKQITYYAYEKKTVETNWTVEGNDSTLQKLRRAIPFSANQKKISQCDGDS